MRLGIVDMVGLAVALAFAVPIAGFGLSLLVEGRPLGAVFLVIAAALLLVEHALTTPEDLPGRLLASLVGRVAEEPGDAAEGQDCERP